MKTKLKYLTLSLLLLYFSCTKDYRNPPSLPAASRNGSNIMAARINGGIWSKFACVACEGGGSGLIASYREGFLQILADSVSTSKVHSTLEIELVNVVSPGVYTIGSSRGNIVTNNADILYTRAGSAEIYYFTDENNKGTVTITKLDKARKIISGTFSFNAANYINASDIKHVTEGRFDISYLAF
jgi:hypothetical protein